MMYPHFFLSLNVRISNTVETPTWLLGKAAIGVSLPCRRKTR